jgi:hypothetical protein
LACLNTETPARSQFPIFLEQPKDARGKRRFGDMILGLRPEHQTVIEGLQPYKCGSKTNLLYLLSEINNADKHRLIQVVGLIMGVAPVCGAFGDIRERIEYCLDDTILEDGAKVLEAAPDVHVQPDFFPLVAFWQGCNAVRGLPVHLTLKRLAEHVSEVIESFGPEFP